MAALEETAIVADSPSLQTSAVIAEGEQQSESALYDLFVALGKAEHRDSFGEYLSYHDDDGISGSNVPISGRTYYGFVNSGGGILTLTSIGFLRPPIKVDPPTTNLQFADESDQRTQLSGRDLVVSDERYVYHLRGGDLVISTVDAEGKPVVLSSTAVSGNHMSLFLVEDRVAVVSNHSDQGAVVVLDVSDREHPKIVQDLRVEGSVGHAQVIENRLSFVLTSSRGLVPVLRTVSDDAGVRYETEAEFTESVRKHFAELVDEHMPHYRSTDGSGELVRGGPLLDATRLTVLPGGHENVTAVATIDLLDDEPGIASAVGIVASRSTEVISESGGLSVVARPEGQAQIFRFRPEEFDGTLSLTARGPWNGNRELLHSHSFNERLFSFGRLHHVSGHSSVEVTEVQQQGAELITTHTTLDLGMNVTSVHFRDGELFVVSHRDYHEGKVNNAAFNEVRRYDVPMETVIRRVDVTNPATPKWRSAEYVLEGFYTYLNFISDDRLIAAGTSNLLSPSREERTFSGSVALFDLSSGQAALLDRMETVFSTGGAVDNEQNPFRWFGDERVLALPVSVDTGTFGWSEKDGWSGGDAVSWVRIDSEEEPLDKIRPLDTHNHTGEDIVRHSAILAGTLYTVSDIESIAGSLDGGVQNKTSVAFGSYTEEASGAIYSINRDGARRAREYLVATHGVETSDLTLAGTEVRDGYAEYLFVRGTSRFLVRDSSRDGLSLLSQVAAPEANVHHNAGSPFDSNRDGRVTAADALIIVNALTRNPESIDMVMKSERMIAPMTGLQMDTNNDFELSAGDALSVINHLARTQARSTGKTVEEFVEGDQEEHQSVVDRLRNAPVVEIATLF